MSATKRTHRNARIATALFLVGLVYAAPSVVAEDEIVQQNEDGSIQGGACFYINPTGVPPGVFVSPADCIPPIIPPPN